MIYREARLPAWVAGLAAFVCFCLLLWIACYLGDLLPDLAPGTYEITLAAVLILGVGYSYLVSRTLYDTLRWRTFEDDTPRCTSCGYDLTGNVSGVCPECGEPTPDRSSSDTE